jgi:hypothetical protein
LTHWIGTPGTGRPSPESGGTELRKDRTVPWRVRLENVEGRLDRIETLLGEQGDLVGAAEKLSGQVSNLGDAVKKIRTTELLLLETKTEVAAKASRRALKALAVACLAGAVLIVAGVAYVGWTAYEVRLVARGQCETANGQLTVARQRELTLADTDNPSTRETHLQSAAALEKLLRRCI